LTVHIGVAGDWHGDARWAQKAIRRLRNTGVTEVYHLGDFGVWPGKSGSEYLREVERSLASADLAMFVTPGNHEDYEQIGDLAAVDRGHDIGEVQWVSDHLALLPRGHRWERGGWSFVSLGGAPSIDRWMRREGSSWWEGEAITPEDVARVVAGGPADVMLAHDSPEAGLAVPRVEAMLRSSGGWPVYALDYAAEGRKRLTEAFLAVEPRVFLHGHYHLRDERLLNQFDHLTHVVAVDMNGTTNNLLVLVLPDRDSSEPPSLRWVR